MTGAAPLFTVVMATFGRGRHILPSVRSILRQRFADFEAIVAGDGCRDETEAVVAGLGDRRLRWLNLDRRVGSQSGPNNAGIAAAQGRIIAYIGHDDLWEPDHLKRLATVYADASPPDFVMSGSVLHPPYDLPGVEVMGLFADGADTRRHYFPPSAFSHLRSVVGRIGGWRLPGETRTQVDDDFLMRAAEAGLRFRSTGVVTMHKFPAAQRYLSYLCPGSEEQEALLQRMDSPGHPAWVAAKVAEARAGGRFMGTASKDVSRRAPGEVARLAAERKGAAPVATRPLGRGVAVRHRSGSCALDWEPDPVLGFRISRASPCPRLLLPVTGGRVRLRFIAAHRQAGALGPLDLSCNGIDLTAGPGRARFHLARYSVEIALLPDAPTVLHLRLSEAQRPGPAGHLAVSALHLTPL